MGNRCLPNIAQCWLVKTAAYKKCNHFMFHFYSLFSFFHFFVVLNLCSSLPSLQTLQKLKLQGNLHVNLVFTLSTCFVITHNPHLISQNSLKNSIIPCSVLFLPFFFSHSPYWVRRAEGCEQAVIVQSIPC